MNEIIIQAFEKQTTNFKADLKREFEKDVPIVSHPQQNKTKNILLNKLKDEIESNDKNIKIDIATIEEVLFSYLV